MNTTPRQMLIVFGCIAIFLAISFWLLSAWL